jgi:anti-sigma-K factor RskA
MRDHTRIEELLSARALGGLDPEEDEALRREMAEHGEDCAECRQLESELDEVAGRLAFALDPVPVSGGFEDRLVAAATSERVRLRAPQERGPRAPKARGWRLRPLVAVAAAVVLFAAGIGVGALVSGGSGVPSQARVVAFEGEGAGTLSVAYRPGRSGLYLLGSGLDAPPSGHVYEVWTFRGATPVPTTCFVPEADGSVFRFVDARLGTADSMAVTVEPSSCPAAPTTSPILSAQLV